MEMMPIELPLERRPAGCPVPLTAFQLRGWKLEPVSARLCAASLRVLGPLNIGLLEESIQVVVHRHDSLRTRIVVLDGIPRQHIEQGYGYELNVVDLSTLSITKIQSEVAKLAQHYADEKIDLSIGPLFEAKLIRLTKQEHVLLLFVHHIVADAVSCAILTREIWTSYDQAIHGIPLALPELPVQFADYAVWQQRTYNEWLEKHAPYWRAHLAGARPTELRFDRGSAPAEEPAEATLHVPFGKALTARLRELATCERVPLSIVVCAIYVATMSRWCAEDDLVVKFVSHGRRGHPELENVIGLLATFLHIRVTVAKSANFLDLLRRVNDEFQSAYQYRDFDRLSDLIPECDTDLFFDWLPAKWWHSQPNYPRRATDPLKKQSFPLRVRWFPKSFFPFFFYTAAGVCMTVVYRADRFERGTIERFGRALVLCATEMTQCPFTSAASVPLSR